MERERELLIQRSATESKYEFFSSNCRQLTTQSYSTKLQPTEKGFLDFHFVVREAKIHAGGPLIPSPLWMEGHATARPNKT